MRYGNTGQDVATGGVTEGPYAMGSLYFNKIVPNGQVFYCPAVPNGEYNYNTYSEVNYPWPAIPADYHTLTGISGKCQPIRSLQLQLLRAINHAGRPFRDLRRSQPAGAELFLTNFRQS